MGITHSKQNTKEDQFDVIQTNEEPWKVVLEKLAKSPVFQQKLSQNLDKMEMFGNF